MKKVLLYMTQISLTRCQFLLPFAHIHSVVGGATERLLERKKLPPNLEGKEDLFVPILNAIDFAEMAARSQGIPDIGFIVSREAKFEYLSQKHRSLILGSPTLLVALRHSCARASLEDTNLQVSMELHRSFARIHSRLHGTAGMPHLEHSQWLQNILVVEIVRQFADPDWFPATFAFEARYAPGYEPQNHWQNAQFISGQKTSYIDIPLEFLHLPPRNRMTEAPMEETESGMNSDTLAGNIKLLLQSYIDGVVPAIADISDMANMSARTLQRLLAEAGYSYRGILNGARFERAALLLKDTDIKIIDIALSLGYSDAAHFTRAFRNMAGISPLQFRHARLGNASS